MTSSMPSPVVPGPPCYLCGRPTEIVIARNRGEGRAGPPLHPDAARLPPPTGVLGEVGFWYEQHCDNVPSHRRLLSTREFSQLPLPGYGGIP